MSRVGFMSVVGLITVSLLTYDGYSYSNRQEVIRESASHQTGKASWYGKEEQGRLTADGEHFNRHDLTAAHRHLPFNTRVRVTNRENGRSVVVRINDRGPYHGHRILDLSEAAADSLGMKKQGVTTVDLEVLPPDTASSPTQP